MKYILAICALALISTCSAVDYAFTGNASTAFFVSKPVIISEQGACSLGTEDTGYNQVYVQAASPISWYYISMLVEKEAIDDFQIQVYSEAYNPASPCTNLVTVIGRADVPHYELLDVVPPGNYTFVAQTKSAQSSAAFALHIDRALWTGGSTANNRWWTLPDHDQDDDDCAQTGNVGNYAYYQWTQPTTGSYDVFVFAGSNFTNINYVAALYNSTPFWLNQNYTSQLAAPSCNGSYVISSYSESVASTSAAEWIRFFGVSLKAGVNYTLVFSAQISNPTFVFGYYGVKVYPSSAGVFKADGYNRPDFGYASEGDNCVASTSTYSYNTYTFQTTTSTYILDNVAGDVGTISTPDAAGCLYQGINVGTNTTPPTACNSGWVGCQDTGDVGPLTAAGVPLGTNFTFVQTTYSLSEYVGSPYILYVYTGVPIPGTGGISLTTGAASGANTGSTSTGEFSSATMVAFEALLAIILILVA